MVRVQNDKYMHSRFHLFSPDQLMSMVLDTPVSLAEEKKILKTISFMERLGLSVLNKATKTGTAEEQQQLLVRAKEKKLHVMTEEQSKAIRKLHLSNVWICFMLGIVSAVITAIIENVLTHHMYTDGVFNTDACCGGLDGSVGTADDSCNLCEPPAADLKWTNPWWGDEMDFAAWEGCEYGYYDCQSLACGDDHNTSICEVTPGTNNSIIAAECVADNCPLTSYHDHLFFVIILLGSLGVCVAFEIGGMYYYSILNSAEVANAIDLKLVPINKDRAFVAASLVRAALELGNANNVVFGVDPLARAKSYSPVVVAFLGLLYKAKILLSGFIIKVAIKRMAARGSAKYLLPWAAVPATAVWNGFVGHVVMKEAVLRGLGVSTGIEIFNEITCPDGGKAEISQLGKLQICRAVGTNIAKMMNMYPTKEVLLKHAVNNMGLIESGQITKDSSGILDNMEDFIRDCAVLDSEDELAMILEIMVLVGILDGKAGNSELSLVHQVLEATGSTKTLDSTMVKYLAQRMRESVPLQHSDLKDCFLPESEQNLYVPDRFWLDEILNVIVRCLAC